MQKTFLGKTKNGKDVFVDLEKSNAATHFKDSPHLQKLVSEALGRIELHGEHIREEVDMGCVIGKAGVVETSENDEIIYALRPHRERYSRFVKNRTSKDTQYITLDLRRDSKDSYDLYTAFVGRLTPSFPGGDYLPEQSVDFWSNHALIWGQQEIVPGTETKECPW